MRITMARLNKASEYLIADADSHGALTKAGAPFHVDPGKLLAALDYPVIEGATSEIMSEQRTVKVVLACTNASGEPEFTKVIVKCTTAQYQDGEHYLMAGTWARSQGYEGPFVCFDEHDRPRFLFAQFNWATATTIGPTPKGA